MSSPVFVSNYRFISLNPVQQGSTLRRNLLPVFSRPALSPPPSFPLLARKCAILLKFQNTLLSALAPRSTLPQAERNTFLEAVACICERREWREYARGMYDETNFSDENSEGSVLGGMIAAMERFREHERMSYHCVSIAMEILGRKNFSGSAVEYCGRVLGVFYPLTVLIFSGCLLLFSGSCCTPCACSECRDPVHSKNTRRSLRRWRLSRLVLSDTVPSTTVSQAPARCDLLHPAAIQLSFDDSTIAHNHRGQ